jgi:hypothetical protein
MFQISLDLVILNVMRIFFTDYAIGLTVWDLRDIFQISLDMIILNIK